MKSSNDEHYDYEIVGFNGLPVDGGIGRKSAVVRDPKTDLYSVICSGEPSFWINPNTLNKSIEDKLITIFIEPLGPWSHDKCISYIDLKHFSGRNGSLFSSTQNLPSTFLSNSLAWCEPLCDALNRFLNWANESMNLSSQLICREEEMEFDSVISELNRARFCITALSDRPYELKYRAAVLMASAYLRYDRFNDKSLWFDISLDFNPNDINRIRSDARNLIGL